MKSLDFNIIPNISLGDMENIMDIEAELDSYLEEEKIENDRYQRYKYQYCEKT